MFFSVFFSSLLIVILLGRMQLVHEWWNALNARRHWAMLIILSITATFLGGGGQLTSSEFGVPGGARLARLFVILILFALANKGIFSRLSRLNYAGGAAFWMVLFGIYCVFSATYSVNSFITAWKGIEVLTLVLVCVSIASELRTLRDLKQFLGILCLVLLFLVITILMGVVLFRGEAFITMELSSSLVARGLGPRMNPNTVTQLSALLAVFTLPVALKSERKYARGAWILFAIGITIMLLGHSRTSIFSCLFAVGAILFFSRKKFLALVFAGGSAAGFLLSKAVMLYIYRGQSKEVFTSLTGRTSYWSSTLEHIEQAPVFGQGYYAIQRSLFSASTVDNTYLDVILGLGIVGLTIFIIPIIIIAIRLFETRPKKTDSVEMQIVWLQLMSMFGILFVRSLTGPSFQVLHPNLVMYMMLLVGVAAYRRINYGTGIKRRWAWRYTPVT